VGLRRRFEQALIQRRCGITLWNNAVKRSPQVNVVKQSFKATPHNMNP
jgi:hypothetical protein